MHLLTVLTPTYNRSKLLSRAYHSLLNQQEQNFNWLIIDDGSNDDTESVVHGWMNEGRIPIQYIKKPNGGKYTAMLEAKKHISGEWVLMLDSDDELTPDATHVISGEIFKLSNLSYPVDEIRAFCKLVDGTRFGDSHFPGSNGVFDATWHEAVLKHDMDAEMLSCIRKETYRAILDLPENMWLSGKFKYFPEAVFWARINTKIRYLNRELRVYHLDAQNSVMRNTVHTTGYYDDIILAKYFLSENLRHFFKRPSYFISLGLKYLVAGKINGVSTSELFAQASGWRFKLLLIILFVPAQLYYWYGKLLGKSYWR